MQWKNSEQGFGLSAIIIHWIMALLIISLLAAGLYMTSLGISEQKLKLYGFHKEFGIVVIILTLLRIIWRLSNIIPSLSSLPYLEKLAARAMHLAFYGFMIIMPLTGWLMSSAAGLPVSFFGLFTLPNFITPDPKLFFLWQQIHKYAAFILIAAILGHTAAALKHHYVDRDDILKRMLWP